MINTTFIYLKIPGVTQVLDLAKLYSNVLKSEYKHNIAIATHDWITAHI